MPKTKKKFIDKKNAVTFHIVHRSQKDPLVADENASKHVLLEESSKEKETKDRREELQKYGIYFDDNYDYLKHLKDVNSVAEGETILEQVRISNAPNSEKTDMLQLPSSVFQSAVEEKEGLLNKIPVKGPKVDWDPDIVAALDDCNSNISDDELEEDFVTLANGIEGESEIMEDRESCEEYEDAHSDEAEFDGDSVSEDEGETKSRVTFYSMLSTNSTRSKHLQLLDEKFEKVLEQYRDEEIGALDMEEIGGYIQPNSIILTQLAEDFEKQKKPSTLEDIREELADSNEGTISSDESLSDSNESTTLEDEQCKADRWDCESILSIYSNHSNHPKLIVEPGKERIKVSGKTGIPTDFTKQALTKQQLKKLQRLTADEEDDDSEMKTNRKSVSVNAIRPKNETAEERKARKTNIKLLKKERRIEKKCNKLAFKEEKKRQIKMTQNIVHNLQSIKLV